MIRALVTGSTGQVGAAVVEAFAGWAEVIAHDRSSLDLADPGAIAARIREARPALVVNAGAYTAVDRAQTDAATAHAVNARAPGVVGEEARRVGALVIHYSTDYVFDGRKAGPHVEDDPTDPLGEYGRSKLAGEVALAQSGCAFLTLRTSWVYGPRGRNFLLTMLNLARTREEVRVVDDQYGAPTSCLQIARATREILCGREPRAIVAADLARAASASGLYHLAASGETSWHGFARAIFQRWERCSPVPFRAPRLVAIPTTEFPTPTPRPANSRLSTEKLHAAFGARLEDWSTGLDEVLARLAAA